MSAIGPSDEPRPEASVLSLAALGSALFALRLLDVVQDPLFGWLTERYRSYRRQMVTLGGAIMAISMLGLFAVTPPIAPLMWFAITLAGVFSGFSLLTIAFYTQGVLRADQMGAGGHTRLATWRETGALIGVCLAAIAPQALTGTGAPFTGYALLFVILSAVAIVAMSGEWRSDAASPGTPLRAVLKDAPARRLRLPPDAPGDDRATRIFRDRLTRNRRPKFYV